TRDTRTRPTATRARGDRRSGASSGCHRGRTGISLGFLIQITQQPPRDPVQRNAHRRVAYSREGDPEIAEARKLRIEGNGAETGNAERRRCFRMKERLDGPAVAAVVAAHVLDVAEDAVTAIRQRGDGARHNASRDLGGDRHEQKGRPGPALSSVE